MRLHPAASRTKLAKNARPAAAYPRCLRALARRRAEIRGRWRTAHQWQDQAPDPQGKAEEYALLDEQWSEPQGPRPSMESGRRGDQARTRETMQDADRDQNERRGRASARRATDEAPDRELEQQSKERCVGRLCDGEMSGQGSNRGGDQGERRGRHFDVRRWRALRPAWQGGQQESDGERHQECLNLYEAMQLAGVTCAQAGRVEEPVADPSQASTTPRGKKMRNGSRRQSPPPSTPRNESSVSITRRLTIALHAADARDH